MSSDRPVSAGAGTVDQEKDDWNTEQLGRAALMREKDDAGATYAQGEQPERSPRDATG